MAPSDWISSTRAGGGITWGTSTEVARVGLVAAAGFMQPLCRPLKDLGCLLRRTAVLDPHEMFGMTRPVLGRWCLAGIIPTGSGGPAIGARPGGRNHLGGTLGEIAYGLMLSRAHEQDLDPWGAISEGPRRLARPAAGANPMTDRTRAAVNRAQ